jgi:hypothetical protein
MYTFLFAEPVVDRVALRIHVREGVFSSPLIRACADGEKSAIAALMTGFWPFVEAFERSIDVQTRRLPVKPLIERFGQARIRRFFADARTVLREMKEEEGSHAQLWLHGAAEIGLNLGRVAPVNGVRVLLQTAGSSDPMEFFGWLAGTEYVAEELAACLCQAPGFLEAFPERRWRWGEAHTAEHESASHLEIDEDLARAYHPSTDPALAGAALTAQIRRCRYLFGLAAGEVLAWHNAEMACSRAVLAA